MFIIQLLFPIFILIKKTLAFYNLKYGNIILDYYNTKDCVNNSIDQIIIPTIDDKGKVIKTLKVLNSEGEIVEYEYSFDFFSSQIYYTNETGDETEEEQEYIYKSAFICNGLCIKRQAGSDILVERDTNTPSFYPEQSDEKIYYSCIYNNIIKSAKITLKTYTSNNCKGGMSYYHFNGTQYCWPLNDSYSFRPLYFEDDNKRIYYHPYNSDHCTTEKMDFFQINENFFKCDGKCHKNIKDDTTSYKCVFKSGEYINLKKLFLFLYLFLLFEMI